MDQLQIEQAQRKLCEQHKQPFLACVDGSIVGVAIQTLGTDPLNGLRHKPERNSNGWYVWGGGLSDAADFFSPLCIEHVDEKHREILPFLGLGPGCRFLLGKNGNVDVWLDQKLLDP